MLWREDATALVQHPTWRRFVTPDGLAVYLCAATGRSSMPVLDCWVCTAKTPDNLSWERPAVDTSVGRHGYSQCPQSLITLYSISFMISGLLIIGMHVWIVVQQACGNVQSSRLS